jgi:hypothetical protein
MIRVTLPAASHYLQILSCTGVFHDWRVQLWSHFNLLSADTSNSTATAPFFHHFFFEFKAGVESIWTGVDLPSADMVYEERLGILLGSQVTQKELRRAYYRKSLLVHLISALLLIYRRPNFITFRLILMLYFFSLQWHPDRWVNFPMYTTVVQHAFEAIGEAYQALGGGGSE